MFHLFIVYYLFIYLFIHSLLLPNLWGFSKCIDKHWGTVFLNLCYFSFRKDVSHDFVLTVKVFGMVNSIFIISNLYLRPTFELFPKGCSQSVTRCSNVSSLAKLTYT